MKATSAQQRAPNQPLLNTELLLQCLAEKGFTDPAAHLVEAKVTYFDGTCQLPYGKAIAAGNEFLLRTGHFYRIPTVVPLADTSVPDPKFGDDIWALVGPVPSKEPQMMNMAAWQWGYKRDLPHSFMVEQTWKIRFIRKVDALYRKWRNSSWRKELRRQSCH